MILSRRSLVTTIGMAPAALLSGRAGAEPAAGNGCALSIVSGEMTAGGFFALYADNRARELPSLITDAFLLHGIALTERRAMKTFERETLVPLFGQWIAATSAALASGPADGLATRLLAVVAALLAGGKAPGDGAVAAELALVAAAAGIATSPVLGIALDYSQMKPRGHYAAEPALSAYFAASRYASTAPLLLNPSAASGVDVVRADGFAAAAIALSRAMTTGAAAPLTDTLMALIDATFGAAEDYAAPDLRTAAGSPAEVRSRLLAEAARSGRLPMVIDVPLDVARLGALSPAEAAISWRMLPGRRLADVAALQATAYPHTGMQTGSGRPFGLGVIDAKPVKAYVGFDDLFAAYGIDAGYWAVERQFRGMDAARAAARTRLAAPSMPSDMLGRLVRQSTGSGLSGRRMSRRLAAIAGHYVHYRHGLMLYAKQSISSAPKGISFAADRAGARLEADLSFLAALRSLVAGHARRLSSPLWQDWTRILDDLEGVAWRTTFACPAVGDETLLNGLDLEIAALADPDADTPIVADIHTVPSEARIVEIGIGTAQSAHAGKARGADFSLYQFKQPIADRLTDQRFAASLKPGVVDPRRWSPAIA